MRQVLLALLLALGVASAQRIVVVTHGQAADPA